MAELENLTLEYLRRLDKKLDRLHDAVTDLRDRIGAMENRLTSMENHTFSALTRPKHRIDSRVERMERRLDLIDYFEDKT